MTKCAGNMRSLYKEREQCIMYAIAPDEQRLNQQETQEPKDIWVGYEKFRSRRDLSCFQDKRCYFIDERKMREVAEIQKKKH